jgi:hypothetical protein
VGGGRTERRRKEGEREEKASMNGRELIAKDGDVGKGDS